MTTPEQRPPPRSRARRTKTGPPVSQAAQRRQAASAQPTPAQRGPTVHLWPDFRGEDQGDGGVRRVVEAQRAWLPAEGIAFTDDPAAADVIACHITVPSTYLRLHPRTPLVAHCHGLYWSEYAWQNWAIKANAEVMELLRVADAITSPSEWVAQTIRRHTSRPVEVIPHGVDLADWDAGVEKLGYALWNKTRPDPVCDPKAVLDAALLLPETTFMTTFAPVGDLPRNVVVTDRQPYEKAKRLIEAAGCYLATAKETFGIGTLESLACGVPVIGYRHGGQVEIIEHGVDGWLAEPGDAEGLAEGVRWALANRRELAPRCREKAARYPWTAAASRYAEIYRSLANRTQTRAANPKVTVVVTAYDLERYLPDCLRSVQEQTFRDWECVVVDDASPDRGFEVAAEFAARDPRFRPIRNAANLYLAGARNVAVMAARGEYVVPLDADDMLAPRALELLAGALDRDRTTAIAYGNVRFVDEDGRTPTDYHVPSLQPGHSGWPPLGFVFENQSRGMNYLPYCSMYRRDVWAATGGYRRRCRTAEDADFWLRASSYGFRPLMVTAEDTLVYRNRAGSMSRSLDSSGWNRWFPWGSDPALAPAGAVTREQMPIPSYDPPAVCVVVPVGPGHEDILLEALDSVDAQSFRAWECVVVNDTGRPLPLVPGWARVVETPGRTGAAAARNLGVKASRAPYFLPLDADDLLQPDALQWLLTAAEMHPDEIIYSDWFEDRDEPNASFTVYEAPDYDPQALVRRGALHAVTALTPRAVWEAVGGYDEALPCWEDWAFALAAVSLGFCSRRLRAPLFTYRKWTGARREANQADFGRCKAAIMERFGEFWDGRRSIMGCGCSAQPTVYPPEGGGYYAARQFASAGAALVRYVGRRMGSVDYRGPSGAVYSFAADEPPHWVHEADVELFTRLQDFEVADGAAPPSDERPEPVLVAAGPPNGYGAATSAAGGWLSSMEAGAALAASVGPTPVRLPVMGTLPDAQLPEGPEADAEDGRGRGQPFEIPFELLGPAAIPARAEAPAMTAATIQDVDPDVAVRALMGLGMSRAEAEAKVRT